MIEPLSQSVYDVNKQGQGLIQSAAGGVNTSGLEKDLEKLNDKWNALKDKVLEIIYYSCFGQFCNKTEI